MRGLLRELVSEATKGWREFVREKQAEYNRNYHMGTLDKDQRLVTRGRYKDRTVRLMGPADKISGLLKCALPKLKKNRDGSYSETDESTEILLSEGQLQPIA